MMSERLFFQRVVLMALTLPFRTELKMKDNTTIFNSKELSINKTFSPREDNIDSKGEVYGNVTEDEEHTGLEGILFVVHMHTLSRLCIIIQIIRAK